VGPTALAPFTRIPVFIVHAEESSMKSVFSSKPHIFVPVLNSSMGWMGVEAKNDVFCICTWQFPRIPGNAISSDVVMIEVPSK
jgi:hypothetical protein